ncbi:HDOD domain-containing protein [Rhodoferax sp. TH121]|uniref:HDOD domain-containing protein n=1 Tax=Rhodoferax sp. TH121 TaxID=2022803 RepID=UPI0015963502|nr:HDOD domain-containing protein [Rhodoferax sp. TH121]
MPDISTFIQTVKLPVMPEVAHALIRTLNDEDADVVTVRDVIAKDPALTATLLRMANSALFGLSRSVTTLDSAVSVVGMSQIRARALGICMAQVFALPPGVNRLEFWRYSMVCAGYAKFLAAEVHIDEQQAWLTAMMLRLGELMIAQHRPQLLEAIEKLPSAAGERWQRERSLVGFDEGQITAEVARRWDFPEDVVQALGHAADTLAAAQASKLCAVVHLAAWLADQAGNHDTVRQAVRQLPQATRDALRLDTEALLTRIPDPETFSDVSTLLA